MSESAICVTIISMTSSEIRQIFLDFFKEKGHEIVPSASLIPEDKTVLFITAGMQPLVPHLMGELAHPRGPCLANSQKCLRTDDILEVGDNRHLTFFEMFGNWSIGDYFKKEAIEWSFELLTSKKWFGIPPEKLFVSVFEGDKEMGIGLDSEAVEIWKQAFARAGLRADLGDRIYAYPKKKNWWELAGPGPCGPDTEIFYDTRPDFLLENQGGQAGNPHDPKVHGSRCHINCDCGRFVEIWNNVFMEYEKKQDGQGGWIYAPLKQKNVDTGMGFERIVMVLQNKETVFDTDLFSPIITLLESLSKKNYLEETKSFRIIADHMRASAFLIAEGILPSNVDRGYILRRLIRRSVTHAKKLDLPVQYAGKIFSAIGKIYQGVYPEISAKRSEITGAYLAEAEKFEKALVQGIKEVERILESQLPKEPVPTVVEFGLSGGDLFNLYQTFGIPPELIWDIPDLLNRFGSITLDMGGFEKEFIRHQNISRAGAEKKFGGHGLVLQTGELKAADEAELKKVTRLHTATHLLQAALRQVLGGDARQKGSDITAERLRFDFSHTQKMTDEEKKKVESLVNEWINMALPVEMKEMAIDEAEKSGALMFQKEKYGASVKVYSIGSISKELCGGPHVVNTREVGRFKILKEEASSAGVRRIRATVD